MTQTRHFTLHPGFGPPAAGSSTAGDGDRGGWPPGPDSPTAKPDEGLAFYWTLTAGVSDVTGAARTLLTFGASDGGGRPESNEAATAEVGRRHGREQRGLHVPPEVPISLRIDAPPRDCDGDRDGSPGSDAFLRPVESLVAREQCRRALRYSRWVTEAFEQQATHDLRTLLQPLVLHTSQLRRAESPSPESLELLDELIRSLGEWVGSGLEDGELLRSVRLPSSPDSDRVEVAAVLEEALAREDPREVALSVADHLPRSPVDRPILEAGLVELLRLGSDVPRTLEVDAAGESLLRLRVEFEERPAPGGSHRSSSETPGHPPVVGGLLNLVAWTDGTLRIEIGPEVGRRMEARLPMDASSLTRDEVG